MPLYEYACRDCGTRVEAMRKQAERLAPADCPSCGRATAALVMSAPAKVGATTAASADLGGCASGLDPGRCCGGACMN